jgi:hypothetical protein
MQIRWNLNADFEQIVFHLKMRLQNCAKRLLREHDSQDGETTGQTDRQTDTQSWNGGADRCLVRLENDGQWYKYSPIHGHVIENWPDKRDRHKTGRQNRRCTNARSNGQTIEDRQT